MTAAMAAGLLPSGERARMAEDPIAETLRQLLCTQRFAVLSTDWQGAPYASLVAFAATEDLREMVFATLRHTRKYENLLANRRAAMLVDNRSNEAADYGESVAATALGLVVELQGLERERLLALYLAKHPHLGTFATAADCALFQVAVGEYVVSRFSQGAVTYRPAP